nr:reverse transcriptase domain-containing protein [Tanacetum cinerariifolium]
VPAQGDDVQESAAEEVANNVIPPTPTSPSPLSLVIPSSHPHQSPCPPQPQDAEGLENDKVAQQLEIVKLKARVKKLEKINKGKFSKLRRLKKVGTSQRVESLDDVENVFNQGRMIVDMDPDEGIELVTDQEKDAEVEGRHADKQEEIYNIDLDHSLKVLSMQEDDTEVQEAVEVVTTAKLMIEVVTAIATQVVAANPEEELPSVTPAETPKVKEKGKGILIEAPKPMKKKGQIEMDAEYAKKLQEEINKEHEESYKNIDWNVALDHVQSKEPQYIKRYHGMKKKPQTESEARKNMIFYLKNTEGYKMEFFKGKKYDEILPIFQAKFHANMRNRLEIVQDEDDDVFVEATPLAQKVPVVDYQIVVIDNKPKYKIIRADDTHQFYISFTTLLKNFDREDLETLWKISNVDDVRLKLKLFKDVAVVAHAKRSRANPTLLNDFEMAVEGNGDLPVPDLQTIEELCQPSLNGRGGPIALIAIQAINFGLQNDMIQQSIKVNGVIDDALHLYLFPYSLIHHATAWFDRLPTNSINTFEQMAKMFLGKYFPPSMVTKLRNEIINFRQRLDESLFEALKRYKLSIDRCSNHNMLPVTQIDTFYNGLTLRHRDTINVAACGTFMKRRPGECYDLIENMTAHRNDWDTSAQRSESSSLITSSSDTEIAALKTEMAEINKNLITPPLARPRTYMLWEPIKANDAILKNMQTNMTSLTNSNLELKNMFGQFIKMNTTSSLGSRTLPGNTITNPKEELKGITTRSGTAYQGPMIPTTSSSLPKVVERETKATKDTVHPTNNESTKYVQPPIVQTESLILNSEPFVAPIIEPVAAPVSAPKPNQRPSIPCPSRLHDQKLHDKANDQREKFFQIFKYLNFNISFADALILMPKFGLSIKSLLTNNDKLYELAKTPLNEHCSAVLLKKLPEKLGDPGKFLIPCDFPSMLSLPDLSPTCTTLDLADHSISRPVRVAKDVYVKVGKFHFLADFVVVDFDADPRVPLILGRSFLKTEKALIDVFEGELTLRVRKEAITFNLDQTLRYSANYNDMMSNRIDVIDIACEEYSKEVLGFSDVIASGNPTPYYDLIVSTTSLTLTSFGNSDDKLSVIIVNDLSVEEKTALITVLKSHKRAITWKIFDIKVINPEFCTHKILIEEDFKPAIQHQRMVNPKIHDVIKNEVLKLLDGGLIYPISDSPWVPQDYNTSSAVPCLFIHILCYSLSLYPFTERYAEPYFFSCLIRQEEEEEPSGDDADEEDKEQDEDDDDEEEEHSASADSIAPLPALRVTARISFRPQPPTLSFTKEDAERADRPEVILPPRKRLSIVHRPGYEAGESSAAVAARPIEGRRTDYGFVGFVEAEIRRRIAEDIGYGIRDAWIDPRDVAEKEALTTLEGFNTREVNRHEVLGYIGNCPTSTGLRAWTEEPEQPLPVAASPTAESPGYIPESDPDEDLEEDDDEVPADYPTDHDDEDDEEEPSGDDAGEEDEEQDKDDDDEEEEHPASADSIPPPPALRARESSVAAAARLIEGRRADYGFVDSVEAEIRRRRAEGIGHGIRDTWIDSRDVTEEEALTTLEGVNTRVTELATVQEQDTQDIYGVMEDTQGRQTEIFQRVETLVDDSQYHYETGRLVDQEARCYREA